MKSKQCRTMNRKPLTTCDNMPESMEGSERYSAMESAIESLQSAMDSLDEAATALNESVSEAVSSLEEASA